MFLFCLFASKKKKKKNYHVLVLLFCKSAGGNEQPVDLGGVNSLHEGVKFLIHAEVNHSPGC